MLFRGAALYYSRMSESLQTKIEALKRLFPTSMTHEERYDQVIALGRCLPSFQEDWKTESRRVEGCQSVLYLHSTWDGDRLQFYAYSEALISRGLAALLLHVYNGATPLEILALSPTFLSELGILSILSPSRSNGLAHMHTKIQQEALQCLMPRISP